MVSAIKFALSAEGHGRARNARITLPIYRASIQNILAVMREVVE